MKLSPPQVAPLWQFMLLSLLSGCDSDNNKFAMCLGYGNKDYLIHGTNKDFGVSLRVSAGCIRLRPDDIEMLFSLVPVGTLVQVINQPVKTALEPDGRRWLEVHSPEVKQFIAAPEIDGSRVTVLLDDKNGLPCPISG